MNRLLLSPRGCRERTSVKTSALGISRLPCRYRMRCLYYVKTGIEPGACKWCVVGTNSCHGLSNDGQRCI